MNANGTILRPMVTEHRTRGAQPDRSIHTEGVDPLLVKLRTEQVRQGLSNYALSLQCGVSPQRLGSMWKGGTAPGLKAVRAIITALRKGNPAFILTDP